MSKLLFYTDLQLDGKTPRHRIDNYQAALLAKVQETYRLAEENDCIAVIFGGDFFNAHRIFNYDIISDVIGIISGSSLLTYGIMGQHDLKGYNPKSYAKSTMAFVVKHCPSFQIIWKPVDLNGATLYACHVWDDFDEICQQEIEKTNCSILIAHKLLTPDSMPFEIISTKDIKVCPFDIVLSGDLHTGFPTHTANGTVFCNPGSIARQTTKDLNRIPKVAIIDTETKEIESIALKDLSPGEEVFGEDAIKGVREMAKMNHDSFIDPIAKFEAESIDIFELVQKVGREKGVRKEVMEFILSRKTSQQ